MQFISVIMCVFITTDFKEMVSRWEKGRDRLIGGPGKCKFGQIESESLHVIFSPSFGITQIYISTEERIISIKEEIISIGERKFRQKKHFWLKGIGKKI